jgi:GMP synthase-like glutamine amidotransferase
LPPKWGLAQRIHSGAPVLGVCPGSQLIAKAAGGVVEPGPVFEIDSMKSS